jgi:hypothetical protein
MKNLIELSFLETPGHPDKILFLINLPYASNHVSLSSMEALPELSRRSGKKTVPATQHEALFAAFTLLMQANPNMFYIDDHALNSLLGRLENKKYINQEQFNAYKTTFSNAPKKTPCLRPQPISNPNYAEQTSHLAEEYAALNKHKQIGEPLLKASPNSAFDRPGMFKPPTIKTTVGKPVSRSLPTETSFFPAEKMPAKKKQEKRKTLPGTLRFEPSRPDSSRNGNESCIIM